MSIRVTAFGPGKIILLGEHGVVYGHPALAAPISRGVRAWAEPHGTTQLELPDGLSDAQREQASHDGEAGGEMFARKETLDLIRAYYQLGERPRRRLLDLAKSLNGDNEAA